MPTPSYVAAVVDETGKVAALGGVYDGVVVNAEHVAATDALLLVALLPHVRNHLQTRDHRSLEPGEHDNVQNEPSSSVVTIFCVLKCFFVRSQQRAIQVWLPVLLNGKSCTKVTVPVLMKNMHLHF